MYNEGMNAEKEALRKKLLTRRRQVTSAQARAAGENIAVQLVGLRDWTKVKSVHVYESLLSLGEVDTKPIIEWLMHTQPHIAITIGISAPSSPLPEGKFDVIFVPVLGFDRDGFRLGMGGGWYDRWLVTQPQAYTIGLAYAWAEVKNMPHDPHDIALDVVIK